RDALDGTLVADVVSPSGDLAFENQRAVTQTYLDVNGATALSLADAALDLRLSNLADTFQYELSAVTPGAPLPASTTTSNTAAGLTGFGEIVWSLADLGSETEKTFIYKVTQAGSAPGVTNDPDSATGKTFQVTISADPEGRITQTTDPTGLLFMFQNTYSAAPARLTVEAEKALHGRTQRAQEFEFELEAVATHQTARNNADGTVVFADPITFATPGNQAAILEEVPGADPAITYDTKTTAINVSARDNLKGQIALETDVGPEQLTFNNTLVTAPGPNPPAPNPDGPLPFTGGKTSTAMLALICLLLLAGSAAIRWASRPKPVP
ncbi:MAG: hypothetical protein LBH68_02620, partial [Bifidobacteriaceae bacterium]|nr:hypothetical protein [Bifidobacteriaceae bacterium]